MSALITCPLCGSIYDPKDQAICQGCPLQHSCTLVRCPQCGFETPDINQSVTVSLAQRLLKFIQRNSHPNNIAENLNQ